MYGVSIKDLDCNQVMTCGVENHQPRASTCYICHNLTGCPPYLPGSEDDGHRIEEQPGILFELSIGASAEKGAHDGLPPGYDSGTVPAVPRSVSERFPETSWRRPRFQPSNFQEHVSGVLRACFGRMSQCMFRRYPAGQQCRLCRAVVLTLNP